MGRKLEIILLGIGAVLIITLIATVLIHGPRFEIAAWWFYAALVVTIAGLIARDLRQ